jgi:hypothetical protein
MQRYTIFFITVNDLHVSGGFSSHHQELKNCTHNIWNMSSLLAAMASGHIKYIIIVLISYLPDDGCDKPKNVAINLDIVIYDIVVFYD